MTQRQTGYVRWLGQPAQAAERERQVALAQVLDGAAGSALPALRRVAARPQADWRDKQNLAAAFLAAGEPETALKWLRRAKAEGGAGEKLSYALALAHLLLGDAAAARESLIGEPGGSQGRRNALLLAALDAGALHTGVLEARALASVGAGGAGTLNAVLDRLVEYGRNQRFALRVGCLAAPADLAGAGEDLAALVESLTAEGHPVTVLGHGPEPAWLPQTTSFRQVPLHELLTDQAQGTDVVLGTGWRQLHDLARVGGATPVLYARAGQFDDAVSADEAKRRHLQQGCQFAPVAMLAESPAAAGQLANASGRQARVTAAAGSAATPEGGPSALPLAAGLLRCWLGDILFTPEPRRSRPVRFSLCIIARDEEATLGRCLESARDKVDEIIVVDTGSQDRTRDIARSFGATVYDMEWQNDFSQARNYGIERATGDWILVLDADEQVVDADPDLFRKLVRSHVGADGLTLPISNLVDETDPTVRVLQENLRLFRNLPHHRFEQPIHEQIIAAIQRAGGAIQRTPVILAHYGYLSAVRKAKNKSARNTALLLKEVEEHPEDSVARCNLAHEYLAVADYQAAREEFQTARRLTRPEQRVLTFYSRLLYSLTKVFMTLNEIPEALDAIEEAIALYPDYTDMWALKGQILARTGQPEQALAVFDHCLALGDASAKYFMVEGTGTWQPWYEKGQVYLGLGQFKEAAEAFARAVALHPSYREAAARLAYLGANMALSEAELEEFDSSLAPSVYADELRAQAHFKAHRFARAGRFAERVNPIGPIALARSAACLLDGDTAGAQAALVGVEVSPSDRADLLRLQAVIGWAAGDSQAALAACLGLQEEGQAMGQAYLAVHARIAVEAPPAGEAGTADVLAVLALLVDLCRYELFERALTVFEGAPQEEWKVSVGKLLGEKGFPDLAFEFLITVRDFSLLDEDACRLLGDGALGRGYATEAEAFYRKAASLASDPALYNSRLANALLKSGKVKEAAEIMESTAIGRQ